MPSILPSWLNERLDSSVRHAPDCGSLGGCDTHGAAGIPAAHLIGVASRPVPVAEEPLKRAAPLDPRFTADLLRTGVPHQEFGSPHVLRERTHLLRGPEAEAQHTQQLSGMCLLEVPRFVFKAAHSLLELDLSENSLASLPHEIQQLSALQTLNVSSNQLEFLPEEALSGLTSLAALDCSKNQISGALFERVFCKALPRLARIDASSNCLTSLSISVCHLSGLQQLDVSGNALEEVPSELLRMPKLATLDVKRNPLRQLPAECTPVLLHSLPGRVGEQLLVGGADSAANLPGLRAQGVTHALSLDELPEGHWLLEAFTGTCLPLDPEASQPLLEALPRCLVWSRAALAHGRRHGMPVPIKDKPAPFYLNPCMPSALEGSDHHVPATLSDTNAAAQLLVFSSDSTKAAAVAAGLLLCTGCSSFEACAALLEAALGEHSAAALRDSRFAEELRDLEMSLAQEELPVPGSPGGALSGQPAPEPQHCWQNHLAPARVMPACSPGHDWTSTPSKPIEPPEQPPVAPLMAATQVAQLMRFERSCEQMLQVIEGQVELNEQAMAATEDPEGIQVAYSRLATLRERKADTLGQLDETFAHLAVLGEDLGCSAFAGSTIHSPWH